MQGDARERRNWWETRAFVAAAALIAIVPLLWPNVPPLVDLPGHMGRYRVQLDYGQYPWLSDWYAFRWALIGNLGVDLLVVPLAPIFGLELAVKLIVIAIPMMTVVGLLWIAREVHGRIPPTALFALPLAYAFPFHFGFVNFALSMATALNGFALWLRLTRQGRLRLRAIVFLIAAPLIWLCHTVGWGMLSVLCGASVVVRRHDLRVRGAGLCRAWIKPAFQVAVDCLPLLPPALLLLFWRSGHVAGETADWFNWTGKALWLIMALRDRWMAFDIASVALLILLVIKSLYDPKLSHSRELGVAVLLLVGIFICMPRIIFGSYYADMRLAPFLIAIAIIAIRARPGFPAGAVSGFAIIGLAFFLVRIASTTLSLWIYDRTYDRELAALDHLPVGARLVSFVGEGCSEPWAKRRLYHLPALALVRRMAFANDQWQMAGAQLLSVQNQGAASFKGDPSQIVTGVPCKSRSWLSISQSLRMFSRDAFDYVWLIQPPVYDPKLEAGLIPVWRDGRSALFRVDHKFATNRTDTLHR